MFNAYRKDQFTTYRKVKEFFVSNPEVLCGLEKFFTKCLVDELTTNIQDISRDYNEASFLFPFWQNYPPDDRGRQPKGDQFPWIEVGEHAIGTKLSRILSRQFEIRDTGIPSGADQRFVLKSDIIRQITKNYCDSAFLSVDIKSVGPRDDAPHAVMSHNQISGDGNWESPLDGLVNSTIKATGVRTSHLFHCSLPPIYILSDGTIAPVITLVVKPIYSMLSLDSNSEKSGQPLKRITLVSIPNGILLMVNPNYMKKYPGLFFPGKDDKGKNRLKVRARVSFAILKQISSFRVQHIDLPPINWANLN